MGVVELHEGDKLPVTVLTGFLGAGKTTLLSRLLRDPAMANAAVIINEFGEIGLDHDLVERSDENVVELTSGCLCCTIRGDLARTVHDLHRRRVAGTTKAYDRIVVETTGLADPAPILQTLITDPLIAHLYRLQGVVTLVDGVNGAATLDGQVEATKQAAVADRIVLTKRDLADPAAFAALRERLARLNPAAGVVEAVQGVVEPAAILDLGPWDVGAKAPDVARWLAAEAVEAHGHAHHHHHDHDDHDHDDHGHGDHGHGEQHAHDPNRHDERIRAFCVRRKEPVPAAALSLFLDLLTAQRGADLLRVKGIVAVAEEPDRPLVLHAVQHVVHEPVRLEGWPSADRDTRIVFITRDVPPEQVAGLLDALATGMAELGPT